MINETRILFTEQVFHGMEIKINLAYTGLVFSITQKPRNLMRR